MRIRASAVDQQKPSMTLVLGFGGRAAPTVFKKSTAVRSGFDTQLMKVNE
jgi:hypothetical protein